MKSFSCRVCSATLHFGNTRCLSCDTDLAWSTAECTLVPLSADRTYRDDDGTAWHRCSQATVWGCSWLSHEAGGLCRSCALTRTRPNDGDEVGQRQLPVTERAKQHLIVELEARGLPVVGKDRDPENGLAFDLLSSVAENVVIGHADGVITLDLAESDDAHRERVRAQLGEPYRTMLGHLRHEVGHYYQWQLVGEDLLPRCRELFGDESADYQEAIDRHYAEGAPSHWQDRYVSTYATMHPFEDFAETFAHVLHITDTVDTAVHYGLVDATALPSVTGDVRLLVTELWAPLSVALNQINRSMGRDDLYPFVIPAPVLDKMAFVSAITGGALPRPAE